MKNKSKYVSGFSLIELLTAIAIIGILSAVVMVSLTSAKLKTKDKTVQAQLSSIKVQAETYYNMNGSYDGLCIASSSSRGLGGSSGPGLLLDTQKNTAIPSSINYTDNTQGKYNVITCHDSSNSWAVEAPSSKSVSNQPAMYCVDSTKMVGEDNSFLVSNQFLCS